MVYSLPYSDYLGFFEQPPPPPLIQTTQDFEPYLPNKFMHTHISLHANLYSYHIMVYPLTLTGLEGHICPSLAKGLEGHICPSVVTSWWRHCDVIWNIMNLVVQKNILHCGQRDMCSWSMVNNEENWLPWQMKDWFN